MLKLGIINIMYLSTFHVCPFLDLAKPLLTPLAAFADWNEGSSHLQNEYLHSVIPNKYTKLQHTRVFPH